MTNVPEGRKAQHEKEIKAAWEAYEKVAYPPKGQKIDPEAYTEARAHYVEVLGYDVFSGPDTTPRSKTAAEREYERYDAWPWLSD